MCVRACCHFHARKHPSSQEVERSIKGQLDETNPKGGRLSGLQGESILNNMYSWESGVKGDGRQKAGGRGKQQESHEYDKTCILIGSGKRQGEVNVEEMKSERREKRHDLYYYQGMCLCEMQHIALRRSRGMDREGVAEGVLWLLNQADAFPKCSTVILLQLGLAHRKQMEVIKPGAGWTLQSHWAISEQAHSILALTHIKPSEDWVGHEWLAGKVTSRAGIQSRGSRVCLRPKVCE